MSSFKLHIPKEVLDAHPNMTKDEIRWVVQCFLTQINRKLSRCRSLDLNVPRLGRIHSHGNKKLNIEKIKVKKKISKQTIKNQKRSKLRDINDLLF